MPFAFVGKANECDAGYPAGNPIVTSGWLGGMGLADNGSLNLQYDSSSYPPAPIAGTTGGRRDPHTGLLLNKNGPTPDCSSAGATIEGWKRGNTLTELGFDYRIGGHCCAGAPRFNITSTAGFTYFAGCAAGTPSPATQDPLQWTSILINTNAQVFAASVSAPTFVFGATRVKSISIIHDEGTDTPSPSDPQGVGLAVIDNININGKIITRGRGIEPGSHGDDDDDHDHD